MENAGPIPNREAFLAKDTVSYIWKGLQLPEHALKSLSLEGHGLGLPSSFKVGHLAQSTIGLSALTAALVYSSRHQSAVPRVTVPLTHAVIEFKSERLYVLDGKPTPSPWGPIGGLHKTSDGYVRIHDNFPVHRLGALELLGLPPNASRSDVSSQTQKWKSVDLEKEGIEKGLVISALRSYKQWDVLPQASAIPDFPIILKRTSSVTSRTISSSAGIDRCLRGLRVVEMSRIIAAPVAGKTLAAHGADVIWVTSPSLPDLPVLDRDLGRGKRTVQLDIKHPEEKTKLFDLLRTADVFIQGYRPGSLASHGLSTADIIAINPNIVIGNMSAYGPYGPWAHNRGFDSLVQTCSGMNISETEHYGGGEPARPTPCQALDHAGGYLLATGIMATLYKRETGDGIYEVDVSLAGVMKYLRSLGQYPERTGFECTDYSSPGEVEEYLETRESGFGSLKAVKHSAKIESVEVGWDIMPKPLGSDEPRWPL
ncbi:CoA-transferase family III [Mytilinidion resinicola]|uniref:CoA-transferase family III n=1 Tax=Mytilinidion resinicola TaxID=574789 RepID=A0A6A6YJR5_9PEZI|nr:CoA-transferase family III [Mytilinidion resinicola]KAF2808799.1 CoA-transferase family III [Mytilinidion resinicola]